MANPLSIETKVGTIGEIFVQLKLLDLGVQAAPGIKDSGNDLIGIKNRLVKFIQVKTARDSARHDRQNLKDYDLLFFVNLKTNEDGGTNFNESTIFVEEKGARLLHELTLETVDRLWSSQ